MRKYIQMMLSVVVLLVISGCSTTITVPGGAGTPFPTAQVTGSEPNWGVQTKPRQNCRECDPHLLELAGDRPDFLLAAIG